jgi:filamentous hemagglutinin family protein
MTTRRSHCLLRTAMPAALLYAAGAFVSVGQAEVATNITSDGTLGTTVAPDGTGLFEINGGTIKGGNQFHSFDRFSVGTGDAAVFNGPQGVKNILSRVTGKLTGAAPSEIDGFLSSAIPGANLYLMNPAGIMFGPNSQLDVSGSFYATTANYIGLADGTQFSAVPSPASDGLLTAAAPAAFGFLTDNPATIDVNTSSLMVGAVGQTLSFVGGTINVGAEDGSMPGYVTAPGGLMNLASVASPGEATFDNSPVNVDGFAQLGDINIRGGSIVGGKDVYIRSGQLVIDEAVILPGFSSIFGLGPPPDGGEVNIKVTGDVVISGTDIEPITEAPPGILTFSGSFDPGPEFLPDAKVPDVNIDAGSVSLSGFATIQTNRLGPGDPSTVTINTNSLQVANGSAIAVFNQFEGPGGELIVNAQEVELSGDGTPALAAGGTGLLSQGLFHPCYGCEIQPGVQDTDPALTFADSGTITVNTTNLSVTGDAVITTDSLAFGRGGDITVNADDILLSGIGAETAGIGAQSVFAGDAGNVEVNATGTIEIRGGARISVSTAGVGNGGTATVSAGESITFEDMDSRILSVTVPLPDDAQNALFLNTFGIDFDTIRLMLNGCCGVPVDADLFTVLEALNMVGFTQIPGELEPGDAGRVVVNTPLLTMNTGTRIETTTGWDGNAGGVEANVGSLFLNDGASLRSTSGGERLSGEIIVGTGDAGTVSVAATDTISISGADSSVSTSTLGEGDGGNISLAANKVKLNNGGTISASSSGTGLAGDIFIDAGNRFDSNGGRVTTQATVSDGGNIQITARERVYLDKAEITTSVESGFGGGGNIDIDPKFVILNQSKILANAFGGPGGNINIVAGNFIVSPDSVIDASSELGIDGTVNISSPDEEVAEDLAVLSDSYLDVTGLTSERCGTTAGASSLVDAGPGGLAVDPDGYLPSFATATNQKYAATGGSRSVRSGERWWGPDADQAALQIAQLTCTN